MARRRRSGQIDPATQQPTVKDEGPPAQAIPPPTSVTVVATVAEGGNPGVDSGQLNEKVVELLEWVLANGGG